MVLFIGMWTHLKSLLSNVLPFAQFKLRSLLRGDECFVCLTVICSATAVLDYQSTSYTIIRLKSVGVRNMQVAILARSPREMALTDRILPRYILSRVRVSVRPIILLYAGKKTRVARMLFSSMYRWIRSAAI